MSTTRTMPAEPESETGIPRPPAVPQGSPAIAQGSRTKERDLLARVYRASDLCQGVVEILDDQVVALSVNPSARSLLGPGWPHPPRGSRRGEIREVEAAIDPAFSDLLHESALDAWRSESAVSFRFADQRTRPYRQLVVTVQPLPREGPRDLRHLCCFRIESRAESARPAPDDSRPASAESADRHRLDTAPALIWTSDAEGERDYFNETWLAFTGRPFEDEHGQGWLSGVHPEDAERYTEVFLEAFGARESFRIEYRLRRRDGLYRWMLDLGVPRRRSDGAFLGYVGSSTDITDRHRAERHLARSERWYRDLIEGTDNLVAQIDPDGYLMFVNPVSREILGAEPEECVGFPFLDFVSADDRERTRQQMARWWRGGSTKVSFENRMTSRTGEDRDLLWTFDVHRDADSQPASLSGIAKDITERKRAERIHKIQSQVLESMVEGVTLTNEEGFVLFTNTALDRMFGLAPGELVGQPLDRLGGRPIDHPLDFVAEQLAARGAYHGRFVHRSKARGQMHTRVRINELDIDGVPHRVSVFEDVSEQQEAEAERRRLGQRIRQAQKLESLGVLAGGIAHDFNNLLMVMLGNASLALQDLDPAASAYRDVEQIETAAMRAADLTKQMLAYSGKGQFLVEPTDLSHLVGDMASLLAGSVAKGIEIDLDLAEGAPRVECDVSQVRQVVLALVTNASEAIGEDGGRIGIETGSCPCGREELEKIFIADELPEGVYTYIRVTDDGSGMDAETRSRIFDPFFTTRFTGRGLGLAAVLGIVRGHHGGIRIETELGTGSTFTVLLPSMEAPLAEAPPVDDRQQKLAGEGTVLVVDDDDTVREMAVRMLERLGFRALSADGGEAAIELYRQRRDEIEAVLLDMSMPGMDGEETFRRLRQVRADVRVILSSGYSEQIAAERFEGQGLAGFLQKPYRQTDLILELDRVIDLRSREARTSWTPSSQIS